MCRRFATTLRRLDSAGVRRKVTSSREHTFHLSVTSIMEQSDEIVIGIAYG